MKLENIRGAFTTLPALDAEIKANRLLREVLRRNWYPSEAKREAVLSVVDLDYSYLILRRSELCTPSLFPELDT